MALFNVIFDLGGCLGGLQHELASAREESLLHFLRSVTQAPELVLEEFRTIISTFSELKNRSDACVEELVFANALESVLSKHMEFDKELIVEAMQEYYRPEIEQWMYRHHDDKMIVYDGVPELLDALRDAGVWFGLLSNSPDSAKQVAALRAIGLDVYFKDNNSLLSSDVGIRKPNVKLFQEALRRWQLLPSQTLMVGDMLNRDVIGANLAGMYSIWLPEHAQNPRCNDAFQGIIKPDFRIDSIAELRSLLMRLLRNGLPAKLQPSDAGSECSSS